jgi:transcriptional regulator with XRE-family HTH domain
VGDLFITKFRKWRIDNELTLEELSDLTGYSTAMLSRVERNQRQLSPLARVRVARRLGVRVRDLFDVEEVEEDATV